MTIALNNFTDITTVFLYIYYSIIRRLDEGQLIIELLIGGWIINISLLFYSIYKIANEQEALDNSTKNCIL
jgi:hypothetical protein